MPKIGSVARKGTFRDGCFSAPVNAVLIAFGNVAAFNTPYHLWSDGGTTKMLKKAQEGRLEVRVFASPNDWIVDEYNEGFVEDFHIDVSVVVEGWKSEIHGLIYTDETFEKEIQRLLGEFNVPNEVYYTEQGMQGNNYVSMSAGGKFFDWFVSQYHERYGFKPMERRAIMSKHDNEVKQVITTLQILKVGARRINDTWRGAATLVYSKKMGDVTKGLRKFGWVRLDGGRYSARMKKGHMEMTVAKPTEYEGPRIYIRGNWSY